MFNLKLNVKCRTNGSRREAKHEIKWYANAIRVLTIAIRLPCISANTVEIQPRSQLRMAVRRKEFSLNCFGVPRLTSFFTGSTDHWEYCASAMPMIW